MINNIDKKELARRQIDASIISFMRDGDPIASFSLSSPASQILRDINKDNPGTLSNEFSIIIKEHNVNPNLLWREFNANAAKFKHARNLSETIDIGEIIQIAPNDILFCIGEWMLLPENRQKWSVSPLMAAFCNYYFRSERRRKENMICFDLVNWVDRKTTIYYCSVINIVLLCISEILLNLRQK